MRFKCTKCCLFIFVVLTLFAISFAITCYGLRRRSPIHVLNETDLAQFSNATWAPRRIPRLIHQTWRSRDVPPSWKSVHDSVIRQNTDEFKYYLWTHEEMRVFVEQREPEFYRTTYMNYPYDIQRADSFRNVVLYHLGGVYIDLDNGCNRPFKALLNALEALDPNSSHLVAYPTDESIGFLIDFVVSTAGHPLHKQIISQLHLFNHNYLFHYLTIYLTAGPLNVMLQERLFKSSKESMVRILTTNVANEFVTRISARTWHNQQDTILLNLYVKILRISGPAFKAVQTLIVIAVFYGFVKFLKNFYNMNRLFTYFQINVTSKSCTQCSLGNFIRRLIDILLASVLQQVKPNVNSLFRSNYRETLP